MQVKRILPLVASLGIALTASAQTVAVHPTPSDLSRSLETVDVMFGRINDQLVSISSALGQEDTARNQQRLVSSVQGVAHQWAGILSISNGREMPTAADLYTIYTEILDVESYIDLVTNGGRLNGQPANIIHTAAELIRAHTELFNATLTLRFAVADRIGAEEASCLHRTRK